MMILKKRWFIITFIIISVFLSAGYGVGNYFVNYALSPSSSSDQREIDVVIEEDGKLYPIEVKMTANPTKAMGKHFSALDNIPGKVRQPGIILCQYDKKLYLKEDLIALPISYI